MLVQPHENLPHRAGEPLVQGEVGPGPVGGAADSLELLQNGGAGLPHVVPDPLDERVPPQVEPSKPLLGQQTLDHVLGGNARVVGSRQPQGAPAAHPLEPDEHILHRIVETVTHVQHRGHVGRRHHDHVGLARPRCVPLG